MVYGKSIRLFLIEGEASGKWKCELSNWTSLAFKIPRMLLSKCSDRPELAFTGVYFLIGKDEDLSRDKVCIGEAEDVLYRLGQHAQNSKEWQDWTDCVVFVSKDDQLNKAMVKYLESSLYDLAKVSERCVLVNATRPTKSSLSEPDEAEMDEFLSNLRLLIGSMGYRFLEPVVSRKQVESSVVYYLKSKNSTYDCRGIVVDDGFVVLKGSRVSDNIAPSFKKYGYYRLRVKLVDEGIIVDSIFTRDFHFSSSSAAASVVIGSNSNGWRSWKDVDGGAIKYDVGELL